MLDGRENSVDPVDLPSRPTPRPTDDHGDHVPFEEFYDDFISDSDDVSSSTPVPEGDDEEEDATSVSEGDNRLEDDIGTEGAPPYQTRSGRRITPNPKFAGTYMGQTMTPETNTNLRPQFRQDQYLAGNSTKKIKGSAMDKRYIHSLDWNTAINKMRTGAGQRQLLQMSLDYDVESGTQEDWSPLAFAAKAGDADADTLTFSEAMNHPNSEAFWKAAKAEMTTLEKMEVWTEVKREKWMNVLPGTWAFRIKRFPTGMIRKFKARFCARGDRQIANVDYFDTFAPVVNWNTVRLLLILSIELRLATKQVDYTAAFVHADIDLPPDYHTMSKLEQERTGVFVEMPRGFAKPGIVLRLAKSLYGLKQVRFIPDPDRDHVKPQPIASHPSLLHLAKAPRNFFLHLKERLENVGFTQAVDVDPCLFISPKVICIIYVDDTLLYAKDIKDIEEVLQRLTDEEHMELEAETEVAGFLGVLLERDDKEGTVTLTQTGLIDRILEALQCEHLPPKDTPADDVLGKDIDGDPPDCAFNYASVIGMMWYVEAHSRPDLGFAVSQAARFAFSPKRSHELAMIRIGQYLMATRDKGMILRPTPVDKLHMECYVDSDFMGLYGKELRSDPINVKSRTGFVICLNGCPIVWSSKLQESISLSTMMAEYYALSTAMREVIPLRNLVDKVAEAVGIDAECLTAFRTTVHEDNNGALSLANLDPGQHTPRSKFYDCKVHWFRSMLKPRAIVVRKIDTRLQLADLFTKPLRKEVFVPLRQLLIGW